MGSDGKVFLLERFDIHWELGRAALLYVILHPLSLSGAGDVAGTV
jgi:hypothetical protein